MKFKKLKQIILILLTLPLLISCSHCNQHLNDDIAPSPSKHNYHRLLFNVHKNNKTILQTGIANISIKEGESINDIGIDIYGFYTGKLIISSENCLFNELYTRYTGDQYIPISSLMPKQDIKYRCIFSFEQSPDQLSDKEDRAHFIKLIGKVEINYIADTEDSKYEPSKIEYIQANSTYDGTYLKLYSFEGQGSIQMLGGKIGMYKSFNVITPSNYGKIILKGCGNDHQRNYNNQIENITFKEVFGKDNINTNDSCLLEITSIPGEDLPNYTSRFDINIYSDSVVRLEEPQIKIIKKRWRKPKLVIKSMDYVIATKINNKEYLGNYVKIKYDKNKEYLIIIYTKVGRSRALIYKNGKILWRE